jgi:hypothetical protein
MRKAKPKSKVEKRGGRRPGAGRKPKPRAPAIPLRMAAGDMSAQDQAKAYLALAIETLATVAGEGASESARVAAASRERALDTDQVLVRGVQRCDLINHTVGDASTRGPIAMLVGTA